MKNKKHKHNHAHNHPCEVDLHVHSTVSDGGKSPSEVVQRAAELGVCVLSLTDHNSIDGIEEAQEEAESYHIKFIPGIEIDTTFKGLDWHILGYGFDTSNQKLNKKLRVTQKRRKEHAESVTKKLSIIGFLIDFQEVLNLGARSISNYHIIRVLMKHKKNRERIFEDIHPFPDIFEVIQFYTDPGKPAYVPHQDLHIKEIVQLIKQAGGVPIVSHPGIHHTDWEAEYPLDEDIKEIVSMGVEGIEAISPKHPYQEIVHYTKLAKKLGVIITAGSDYHGVNIPGIRKERYRNMPYSIYIGLKNLLDSRKNT